MSMPMKFAEDKDCSAFAWDEVLQCFDLHPFDVQLDEDSLRRPLAQHVLQTQHIDLQNSVIGFSRIKTAGVCFAAIKRDRTTRAADADRQNLGGYPIGSQVPLRLRYISRQR